VYSIPFTIVINTLYKVAGYIAKRPTRHAGEGVDLGQFRLAMGGNSLNFSSYPFRKG
jgi:hypothetical protein